MGKSFKKDIKEKTSNDIYDGIGALLVDDDPDLLTITNISKRSGYSIGNIYHHFKNIDSVIDEFLIHRVRKRTKVMIAMINEMPPTATAKEIIRIINDYNFDEMTNKMPKNMLIKLANKIMNKTEVRERLDEISLSYTDSIEAMINRNETNTFKNLTHAEVEMALLMSINAIRKPVICKHKLAFTEAHRQQSLALMMALYVK